MAFGGARAGRVFGLRGTLAASGRHTEAATRGMNCQSARTDDHRKMGCWVTTCPRSWALPVELASHCSAAPLSTRAPQRFRQRDFGQSSSRFLPPPPPPHSLQSGFSRPLFALVPSSSPRVCGRLHYRSTIPCSDSHSCLYPSPPLKKPKLCAVVCLPACPTECLTDYLPH